MLVYESALIHIGVTWMEILKLWKSSTGQITLTAGTLRFLPQFKDMSIAHEKIKVEITIFIFNDKYHECDLRVRKARLLDLNSIICIKDVC